MRAADTNFPRSKAAFAATSGPTSLMETLKFWNRYSWTDFYFEYAVLSIVAAYYALHKLGESRNGSLAQNYMRHIRPVLNVQFAQVGVPSAEGKIVPLSHDGAGVYESYATGRVNINRLWVEIRTTTRHDLAAMAVEYIAGGLFDFVSWEGDVAEIVIEPSVEWEGFTWAVISKSRMRKLRESRYDLV
jgi:hypothetical protein